MKLFHFPRACSRVTMTALEEAGFEYEDQVVNIMKGEQKNPEYLAVHRSGKVPALQVETQVITENASIIYYLHNQKPDAGILPPAGSDVERAQQVSDLAWCSGTVHPTMRQIRMPIRFTDGDPSGIQQKGHELLACAEPRCSSAEPASTRRKNARLCITPRLRTQRGPSRALHRETTCQPYLRR